MPASSRDRGDRPASGEAVARQVPRSVDGTSRYYGYPYSSRYYWPGYGFGLGYYYDPYWYDPFYYGGYGTYGYPYGGYGGYGSTQGPVETGSLRLKLKPRDAQVYVDGFYVGTVDDFDGIFQRLTLEAGGHRIEVRAPGYQTETFDVLITPGETVTYEGELK